MVCYCIYQYKIRYIIWYIFVSVISGLRHCDVNDCVMLDLLDLLKMINAVICHIPSFSGDKWVAFRRVLEANCKWHIGARGTTRLGG